jgi:hypothetical protein
VERQGVLEVGTALAQTIVGSLSLGCV